MMPLTDRQLSLWRLKRSGLRISEIAARLGISRQAVHKGLRAVEAKIYRALVSAAMASKVEIRNIDVEKGLLVGWSPWLKVDVYILFSAKNGVQIWFKHEGNCRECPLRDDCRSLLLDEAEERGIMLPKGEDIEPSQLAKMFFKKLLEV
ncbi:MAG: hypothetical protein J7L11_10400 [Thermoprotei archaeon]|nr:hypothetical protein [Thermoprotei archaeon]